MMELGATERVAAGAVALVSAIVTGAHWRGEDVQQEAVG